MPVQRCKKDLPQLPHTVVYQNLIFFPIPNCAVSAVNTLSLRKIKISPTTLQRNMEVSQTFQTSCLQRPQASVAKTFSLKMEKISRAHAIGQSMEIYFFTFFIYFSIGINGSVTTEDSFLTCYFFLHFYYRIIEFSVLLRHLIIGKITPNIVTPTTSFCICVPPGSCPSPLPSPPTDGSGQIDVRIVNNVWELHKLL